MAALREGPGNGAGRGPVRPPPELLELLVRAAAIPGVGPARLARAVEAPRGAEAGLRDGIRRAEAKLSEAERVRVRGWVPRILATMEAEGHHVLVPGLTPYPDALKNLDDPPYPLYARGRLALLDTPTVAVVGTRGMTGYGRDAAHRIAGGLAAAGATVVSGLARGVDGTAHRAAGAERTIGVVGCGLDVAFPTAHASLQAAIGERGLLLSEQLPGTPASRHAFPRRNRIIAAISRAVVVVEAPHGSGALSTAAQAREQGKDVFAVPGPIGSRNSEGTNALIRDGGTLITGAREVITALGLTSTAPALEVDAPPAELEGQALALWRVLDAEPRHADEVATAAGLDPQRGLASLLSLEIQGYARQVSGLRFVRALRP